MQKFIHVDFEIDLASYQINRVSENQWFNDQFFTKYTFPFELKLTDELNAYFGGISDYNIENPVTYYTGYFFIDGKHEEAILEINDIVDKVAQLEISYGFDEFPNFDTKLSELPLEKNTVVDSLFIHATSIITKTFPEVNYNFPQVHTDSFDASDEEWNGFEGIINNYDGAAFLVNEFDSGANETYNRNIMIPMPYLMHVLIAGFDDAGYDLKGDILTDVALQKMILFRETEEYVNARIEGDEVVHASDEYQSTFLQKYKFGFFSASSVTTRLGVYQFAYTFPKKGRYKVAGNMYLRRDDSEAEGILKFKGVQIWRRYEKLLRAGGVDQKVKTVDVYIDVDDLADQLIIETTQIPHGMLNDVQDNEAPLVDLTITPIAIYDENGDLIPPVITTSKIDLTKVVPDLSFGDLVKAVKNWKNMDLKKVGNEIHMNYIEPQMSVQEAVDLSAYEVESPRRRFNQGDSFLLAFKDLDSEDFNPQSIFVDLNGAQTDGYTETDKTVEITVNAIPLPNVFRNGITTALAVDDGSGSLCVVLYEGAANQLNVTEDTSDILLPAIYEAHWAKWISFRIKSQGFVTTFEDFDYLLRDLEASSKVFMYNNYHLIRVLNKTNIPGEDVLQVELELESLK